MPINPRETTKLLEHLLAYLRLYLTDYYDKYDFLWVVKNDLERMQELIDRMWMDS